MAQLSIEWLIRKILTMMIHHNQDIIIIPGKASSEQKLERQWNSERSIEINTTGKYI